MYRYCDTWCPEQEHTRLPFKARLKDIKHRESNHNKSTPLAKSIVTYCLYQRVSVAIIRAIAYNVMEYRCWRPGVPVPLALAVAAPVAVPAAVGRRSKPEVATAT